MTTPLTPLSREQLEVLLTEKGVGSLCVDEVLATFDLLRQRVEELEAQQAITMNGARMLALFVLNRLPKRHTTHNDGELFNVATGFMKSGIPHTTPWLLQMMEVARRDKNKLPQLLFQANEKLETVTQEREEFRSSMYERINELTELKAQLQAVGSDLVVMAQYVYDCERKSCSPLATKAQIILSLRAPRFDVTSCSQCGKEFGPGNSGYSHCDQHKAALTWKVGHDTKANS